MNAPKRHWNTPRLTRLDEVAEGAVVPGTFPGHMGMGTAGAPKTHLRDAEVRFGTEIVMGVGTVYSHGGVS